MYIFEMLFIAFRKYVHSEPHESFQGVCLQLRYWYYLRGTFIVSELTACGEIKYILCNHVTIFHSLVRGQTVFLFELAINFYWIMSFTCYVKYTLWNDIQVCIRYVHRELDCCKGLNVLCLRCFGSKPRSSFGMR